MHFLALTVRFFSRHYFQVCWLHGDYYKKQLKVRLKLDQSQVWISLVKSLYSERCTENYILYFQDMNGVTSSLIVWISDIEGLAYRNELIGLITGLMAAYLNDQPLNQSSANTEPVSESADLCSKPNRALSIPQFLKNFANSFLVMTAMLVLKIWKYLRVEKNCQTWIILELHWPFVVGLVKNLIVIWNSSINGFCCVQGWTNCCPIRGTFL